MARAAVTRRDRALPRPARDRRPPGSPPTTELTWRGLRRRHRAAGRRRPDRRRLGRVRRAGRAPREIAGRPRRTGARARRHRPDPAARAAGTTNTTSRSSPGALNDDDAGAEPASTWPPSRRGRPPRSPRPRAAPAGRRLRHVRPAARPRPARAPAAAVVRLRRAGLDPRPTIPVFRGWVVARPARPGLPRRRARHGQPGPARRRAARHQRRRPPGRRWPRYDRPGRRRT